MSLLDLGIFRSDYAHAQTIRQLKRDLDLLPRTAEKKRRSEKKIRRQDDVSLNGFRIHNEFSCVTNKNIIGFNIQDISEQSTIDTDNLNDPQIFLLAIHIIKAHLNIALKLYLTKGLELEVEKYPVRFHVDKDEYSELDSYPKRIAIQPNEPMKIFFPDTVRSIAYIQYVILPNFKNHISPNDYKLLKRLMRVLSFEQVIQGKSTRKIWTYQDYKKYVQIAKKFLDKINSDFLQQFKINKPAVVSKPQDILSALLLHNWISYLALRSCGFVPYPEDPLYDANLYYDATPARDNYYMGMGIFEEFKQEFLKYQDNNNPTKFKAIQNYIRFFDGFYKNNIKNPKDIEPSASDDLPFEIIKKLHIQSVCSLKDMSFNECYITIDKQLMRLEGLK